MRENKSRREIKKLIEMFQMGFIIILGLLFFFIQSTILSIIPTLLIYFFFRRRIGLYKIFFILTSLIGLFGLFFDYKYGEEYFRNLPHGCGDTTYSFLSKLFSKWGIEVLNSPHPYISYSECPDGIYLFGIGLLITSVVGIYSYFFED